MANARKLSQAPLPLKPSFGGRRVRRSTQLSLSNLPQTEQPDHGRSILHITQFQRLISPSPIGTRKLVGAVTVAPLFRWPSLSKDSFRRLNRCGAAAKGHANSAAPASVNLT